MRIEKIHLQRTQEVERKKENQAEELEKNKLDKSKDEKPAAIYEQEKKPEDKGHIYDAKAIAKLKQQTENNKLQVIELIKKAIGKQTRAKDILNMDNINLEDLNNFNLEDIQFNKLENLINVDEDVRLEAEQLISEDGELGIEKTSQRIVDFAIAISGGDRSKAGILKDAIDKGFKEAEKLFGGKLPQISLDTYDRVMEKFDAWVNETRLEEKVE